MAPKIKKKGKKSRSASGSMSDSPDVRPKADPIPPPTEPGPPQPSHQENLKAVLTGERVDMETKEFLGERLSAKIFDHLTTHEIRDLKTVFDAFANKKGHISAHNIKKAFRALGFKMTAEQAAAMVADIDLDRSGTIDFDEFLQFIIDKQGTARDVQVEISQGFRMFDYDGTGHLTLENLKRACKDAGVKFTDLELREMIEEADRNGDNMVDLEEFTSIMLKTNLF